jgi:F0F1-type ATP synthase assembly protein I
MLALVDLAGAVEMRHLIGNLPESRRATGVGLTMGVSVGLFAYGGLWLDAQFGTKPWLLLLCVAAGILGSVLHMVRVLMPEKWPWPTESNKASESNKAADSNEPAHEDTTANGPPPPG